jgi:hypothetical protein
LRHEQDQLFLQFVNDDIGVVKPGQTILVGLDLGWDLLSLVAQLLLEDLEQGQIGRGSHIVVSSELVVESDGLFSDGEMQLHARLTQYFELVLNLELITHCAQSIQSHRVESLLWPLIVPIDGGTIDDRWE